MKSRDKSPLKLDPVFAETVDFGKTAEDYARFRADFPSEFFDRLAGFGIGLPGQRLLDLGTGTGALARNFGSRGCKVTGLDKSESMTVAGQRLSAQAGLDIEFMVGSAEETGLADESFDVVTAGQCWHWFHRSRVAAEAFRLLRLGGSLLIAHFDWIPVSGNVVEATERLIEKHNPEWRMGGGTGLYPQWLRGVVEASFGDVETFSFDADAPYSHEAWRGRIRASAGVGASLPPEKVEAFDAELMRLLADRFPQDPLAVLHRSFGLVARKLPS